MEKEKSKKERILERLDEGRLSIDEIAGEMGVNPRYVYSVRYDEKRAERVKASIAGYGR